MSEPAPEYARWRARRERGNPASRGVVPVALLGTSELAVGDIDLAALRFGSDFAEVERVVDRSGTDIDGYVDLLLHFRIRDSGIQAGDTEACIRGTTLDGAPFVGCDAIRAVPDG